MLTIGMVGKRIQRSQIFCVSERCKLFSTGHPNVGKSSLINGLMGKKVGPLSLTQCYNVVINFSTAGEHISDSRTHQTFSDNIPDSFNSSL